MFKITDEGCMFERFTEKAIRTIMLAQEESRRLGHNYVGTEQILLGILEENSNIAAKVLNKFGVSLKTARITVESVIGKGSGFVAVEIPFTPKSKSALENSWKKANEFYNNYIAPEHLLLGILEVKDCVALKILELHHVSIEQLRSDIMSKMFQKKDLPEYTTSYSESQHSKTTINADIEKRIQAIEEQMPKFQKNEDSKKIDNNCVFIGHGRNKIWARLNSFLRDEMCIDTDYFERDSQVGKSVITALENCLDKSSFAVIIMTAEDETSGGEQRARQNVIHEIGLFQGRLGFEKVAILLQEGVEQFSNIAGLQYIPFSLDNIEQTFYQLEKMLVREGVVAKRISSK